MGMGGGVLLLEDFRVDARASSPTEFIALREVFRRDEFEEWYVTTGRGDLAGARSVLSYHVSTRRLRVLKRGVYAHMNCADGCLMASRLTPDAVLAFDSGLRLRGLIMENYRASYFTRCKVRPFCASETEFRPVRVHRGRRIGGVEVVLHEGHAVRVTTLECTFVDCVDRLDLAPELPELINAFREAKKLNVEATVGIAIARGSRLVVSRLAFCLFCAGWRVSSSTQRDLERHGLQQPDYFRRSARGPKDSIINRWNLIVTPEQFELYAAELR